MNASMNNAQRAAGVGARDLIPALPPAALDATDIRYTMSECALGTILVAHSARGLCAILIGDQPQVLEADLHARFATAQLSRGEADLEQLAARIAAFVEAPASGLELPLDLRGTAFQRRVWQALRAIPAGHTATYAEIARRIGAPQAVRAVAGACATNPLAVVVPCHRVLRAAQGQA